MINLETDKETDQLLKLFVRYIKLKLTPDSETCQWRQLTESVPHKTKHQGQFLFSNWLILVVRDWDSHSKIQ